MIPLPPITRVSKVGNVRNAELPFIPVDLGKGTTYYVSTSGSDFNDGTSPQTPWKTVDPVNRITLKPGDNVLFRRGDVFVGAHLALRGNGCTEEASWITIDAYGDGANPLFKDASTLQPAISLQSPEITGGYRIRHIDIDTYLLGIAAVRVEPEQMIDGLKISDCTIRNITTNRYFDSQPQLPCGAPLAFGMWLRYVQNLDVCNLTIDNTDSPFQFCGGLACFDNMDIQNSHIQGIMIYGCLNLNKYDEIMATDGNVVIQNSCIRYTGDRATKFGSTAILTENIRNCIIRNVEVGYVVNTLGGFDACALDWEQSNINCTFEQVYAHDNQGPFVLAMEHPESLGNSRGNVIRNCVSVNNGRFGGAESNSFINYSSYNEEYQKIRIENCVDISEKSTIPYAVTSKEEATFRDEGRENFPLIVENLISGGMDICAHFNSYNREVFETVFNAHQYGNQLVLHKDGRVRTAFSASDYAISTYMKGNVQLRFLSVNAENNYEWNIQTDAILAQKRVCGELILLKTIPVPGLDTSEWTRVRVETEQGTIRTYIEEILVDELADHTFMQGAVELCSLATGMVREFFVYRYIDSQRHVVDYEVEEAVPGGEFIMDSQNGEYGFFSPEICWIPTNMYYWEYRPFRAGWGRIGDYGAMITRKDVQVDVTFSTGIQVVMMNATQNGTVFLEFSPDGVNWYGKPFDTPCMDDSMHWVFRNNRPAFNRYRIELKDLPQWTGSIHGLRLRFAAGCGTVAIKSVTIYR
ncbi:MAG: hypothetical protein PHH84_02795 [Oscillospiraceae bacterium]|nr:hypothetical protein [Oscillospiraceae bacterium]MDD4413122.1 hypothetical protein [Oscillospiraceae bacterium]